MDNEIKVLRDTLTGCYSLILRDASNKPDGFKESELSERKPTILSVESCVFCLGQEGLNKTTYSIGEPWRTRAIENKWPFGEPHNLVILSNQHIGLYDLDEEDWIRGFDAFRHFDNGKMMRY